MKKSMTSFLAGMAVVFAIGIHSAQAQTAEELLAGSNVLSVADYENTLFGQRMSEHAGADAVMHFQQVPAFPMLRIAKSTAGSSFRGCVINDASWPESRPEYGLYDITPSDGGCSPFFIDNTLGVMHADMGSAIIGDHYYFVTGYSVNGIIFYIRYAFDLEKMEYENANIAVPGQSPSYLSWTNTPYDAETGKAYGLFFTDDGRNLEFCAMDFVTMTREPICQPGHTFMVMAINDDDAQLYGIDVEGDLYRIDKTSGNETFVGATGLHPSTYHQAAAIDAAVGKLFWAYILDDNTSGVAEVDLKTAQTNKMQEFDRVVQFGDFYNIAHGVEGAAPGQVEHLVWNPNEANYENIDVAFTMPVWTNDGTNKLEGQLTYSVMYGETVVAQGTAVPGGKVATTIGGLPQQQVVTLSVFASNNDGRSIEETVEVWAGLDVPMAPADVTLVMDGDQARLSWSAVTTGVHGGYVVAEQISYVVRKQPEGTVKATTKETNYNEDIEITRLDYVKYSVEAVAEGVGVSEPSFSNRVKVGEYLPTPYTVAFGSSYDVDGYWEAIDANDDGVTWGYESDSKCMRVASSSTKADDWLLSPPFYLENGYEYTIRMEASTSSDGVLSLAYGKPDVTTFSGLTTLIDDTVLPSTMEVMTLEGCVTPMESGVYRFAIRATENTLAGATELKRFSISGPSKLMPPVAPSDFTVTAGEKGELSATIRFVTPQQATDGSVLDQLSSVEIIRNRQIIATFQQVGAGQVVNYVDKKVPTSGKYVYSARASYFGVQGEAASQEVFIGVDKLAPPTDLAFVDNGNGTVTLSWTNQQIGVNGGYVEPVDMENKVYVASFDTSTLPLPMNAATIMEQCWLEEMMALVKNNGKYTEAIDLEGEPGWVLRAVTTVAYRENHEQPDTVHHDDQQIPVFEEGAVITNGNDVLANGFAMIDEELVESEKASVAFLIKGTPALLPMTEHFANQQVGESEFWWTRPLKGASSWQLTNEALDRDGGAVTFVAKAAGDEALLGTRKISLEGTRHPMMVFDYKGGADCTATLAVLVDRGQKGVVDTLSEIRIDELNESEGFERAYIDLEPYVDDNYIILQMVATAEKESDQIIIDHVEVRDLPLQDLAVDVVAPRVVMTGNTADFIVNVTNYGMLESDEYVVSLTAEYTENGKKVTVPLLSDKGFSLDAMGGNDAYHAQLDITPFILGVVRVKAAVEMASDTDPSNNAVEKILTATSVILPGTDITMPAPYGLTAWEESDGVHLQWGVVDNTIEYLTTYNEMMVFYFKGINIYMDGKLLTTLRELVNETVLQDLEEGEHEFYITLLYGDDETLMESPLSNMAYIVTDGIARIFSTSADIVVYNANGVKVAEGVEALSRLPKGVYILYDKREGTSTRMVKK